LLAGSTIKVMHKIAGEERHPQNGLWTALLQLQTALDWSLWIRRVDVALIGGDPLLLARRVTRLLTDSPEGKALRIAIIHPGVFSGAPLSALEDPDLRAAMSLHVPSGIPDEDAPLTLIREEIRRAASLLNARGGGGVMAFEMTQGLFDEEREETVLRLTRHKDKARRRGICSSATPTEQVMKSSSSGRSSDLYTRSEQIFRQGLTEMRESFLETLVEPPAGQRFADLIIADHCELLSGFISPPAGSSGPLTAEDVTKMVGTPYRLAEEAPRRVAQAVDFWREDFGRAAKDPIS